MGLISAALGSASSVLSDQWREYFYCDSISNNVLVTRGVKKNTKNNRGNDNIISNGSIIAVNEGQCMIIVDQGGIVDVCAEAGEFVFDSSSEPSIFYGGLGKGIKKSFDTFKKRVGFGGEAAKDQRIYFFNTKEIIGNKYGTASPVPFRVVDRNANIDIDINVRCHGEYAYRIVDPILFYKNVCGNVTQDYTKDRLDSQLKSELLTALQPAFARISEMGIRYSAVPGHAQDLGNALNEVLSGSWGERYGIQISTFGVNSLKAEEEDEKMIKELQKAAALKNPGMGAAVMTSAAAQAIQDAAKNEGGAMMGFAGLNMAMNASGINAQNLYAMDAAMQGQSEAPKMQAGSWTCAKCGRQGNTGKFCSECGSPKPAENFWTCAKCGAKNKGKFCPECGSPKPAGVPQYKCDKCGWEPEDPANPPKFCPQCGDPFDDGDLV